MRGFVCDDKVASVAFMRGNFLNCLMVGSSGICSRAGSVFDSRAASGTVGKGGKSIITALVSGASTV